MRRGRDKKIINTNTDFKTTDLIPWEIEEATKDLPNSFKNNLLKLRNQDNALTIAKFIIATKNEINLSDNYRKNLIDATTNLSKFYADLNKSFSEMTGNDLQNYLNRFRKPEPIDPLHKWIGTYNANLIWICKFFKWLHYPDLSSNERLKKQKPSAIENLTQLRRKETSTIKPTDLWTVEDDQLFLKYCPTVRERCYHTVSRDTACRPHEILGLRMKDIVFKMTGDRRQYAEVLTNGKTGSKTVPLIDSIPYVKDWIDVHPQRTNPNAYFIFGMDKSYGKRLKSSTIHEIYHDYKKKFFPRLLENPSVSPEDKLKIKELLKKPWNPYIRRHSALTETSKIVPEATLRQIAGWSPNSKMPQKYLHYLGNEANELILQARGLKPKFEQIDKMKPKQCTNCNELAKIDDKFCPKCRMVLSYDAYTETIQENDKVKNEIDELKHQFAMKEKQHEMKEKQHETEMQEINDKVGRMFRKLTNTEDDEQPMDDFNPKRLFWGNKRA